MLLAQQLPPSPRPHLDQWLQHVHKAENRRKTKKRQKTEDLMTSRNQLPFACCFLSGNIWKETCSWISWAQVSRSDPSYYFTVASCLYLNVKEGPGHDYLYSGSLVGYGTLGHSASKGMRAAFWSGSTGGTLNMFTSTSSKVLPLAFGLTKCFQRRRHYVICDWLVTLGVTACVVLQLVGLFMLLGSIHTLT